MASSTTQDTNNKVVISNQEITSRKWKLDSLFKFLSGIIYGVFFGLLPASFKFGTRRTPTDPSVMEICSIIGLLVIGIFSLILLFWLFKGDIKKRHPISYFVLHLFNSIFLTVGILLSVILYPNHDDISRYFIFAVSYGGWAIVMAVMATIIMGNYKKQFPLSWSRVPFAFFTFIFLGAIEVLIFLSGFNSGSNNINVLNDIKGILFQLGALVSFIISVSIFGFGIAFIKRFRDVLLGERTDNEIDTIKDWESARVSSIIIASVVIMVYSFAIMWSDIRWDMLTNLLSSPLYIEIAIDLVMIIPYIVLILVIRNFNAKKSKKGFVISRIFKTIDNGLLLDVFAWIIVVKSALIQGAVIANENALGTSSIDQRALMLLLTFLSVAILYSFSILVQINIPNLRNTAVSIFTVAFNIILVLFAIMFAGYLQSKEAISKYTFVLMSLFVLIGISISLTIKILMIAKIFKVRWTKQKTFNRSYLVADEIDQKNSFLSKENDELLDASDDEDEEEDIFVNEKESIESVRR
ncbi:MAG: hypothetical protein HDR43_01780 [Mycoplasma sp.]|nr:hypothetical protein [Mycoplasma sp.]